MSRGPRVSGEENNMKRETDAAAVAAIQFGSELPEDLAAEMKAILAQATAQIQTIIEKKIGRASCRERV